MLISTFLRYRVRKRQAETMHFGLRSLLSCSKHHKGVTNECRRRWAMRIERWLEYSERFSARFFRPYRLTLLIASWGGLPRFPRLLPVATAIADTVAAESLRWISYEITRIRRSRNLK